jgi:hypothetical protein
MRPSAGASTLGPRATPSGGVPTSRPSDAAEAAANFDWAIFGWYALLLVHAVRRHKLLFCLLCLGVVGASLGLMSLLPKTYEVQTTLQVLRPAGLSNGADAENQTKQAAQAILRRDNLIALLRQTDFREAWPEKRAPLLKLKDAVWARLFRKPSEEAQTEAFVGLLEKELWVSPGDGVITVGVHLPDNPDLALRLVQAALQNFLDARHAAEISSIGEVISILETRTGLAHEALDGSLSQLQDLRTARSVKLGRGPRRGMAPALASLPDPETEQLLVQVKSKRLAIADLEDFHRRRIADFESRLAELKSKYSETHPAVLDLEEALESQRPESAQVQSLRRELAPLEGELKQKGFDTDAAMRGTSNRNSTLQQTLEAEDPREDEDPDIDFAKSQVRHALAHYNEMLDRTAAARLEQDRAGAAFKYRYVVLWPAQMPLGPYRPKPLQILLASLLAGLLFSVLGVAFVDVTSKKLVEPWQVEHLLRLPTLGRVKTEELAHAREGPLLPGATPEPLVPSAEVTELWRTLMVRPWTTLAVVSTDDGNLAWRLARLLVAAAGEHQRPVLKAVNLLELSVNRAGAVAQALAAGNFSAAGERMRFVVAVSSPVADPIALSILTVCDAMMLLLTLDRSKLPDAETSIAMAGAERVLGVVLSVR